MKRLLITALLGLSSLSADPNTADQEKMITPPVGYKTSDRPSVIVEGEFLWWTADVGNLSYARKAIVESRNSFFDPDLTGIVDHKKEEFDWGWDPGVRARLGVISDYDGWDATLSWTYFYISDRETRKVPPFQSDDFADQNDNPVGTELYTSGWFLLQNSTHFNEIKARASVLFNQIDLQQGRNFWMSDRLSLRPFMGVRSYWSRLFFDVHGERPTGEDIGAAHAMTRMTQNSWTVGLLMGMESDWLLGYGLSLFGEFDFALGYGRTKVHATRSLYEVDNDGVAITRNFRGPTHDYFYQLTPFIDLGMGIRFNHDFDPRLRLILDAGWEYHMILKYNQLFIVTTPTEANTDLPAQNGNLSMTGFVLRGRLEF